MFDLEIPHSVMPSEDLGIYTKLRQRDSVSDDIALDVSRMIFATNLNQATLSCLMDKELHAA